MALTRNGVSYFEHFSDLEESMCMLQQGNGGKVDVPLQFQKQWMQSLPRLLWELKHTHVSVSQVRKRDEFWAWFGCDVNYLIFNPS